MDTDGIYFSDSDMTFLPQTIRGWVGAVCLLCSLVLGIRGGLTLGRHVEFWSQQFCTCLQSRIPGYSEPVYNAVEYEEGRKKTFEGLYMLSASLTGLITGIIIGQIRPHPTGYVLKNCSLTGTPGSLPSEKLYSAHDGHHIPDGKRIKI
jgi:hypothetical protein